MAIVFDSTSSGTSAATFNIAHSCTGSNLILIVTTSEDNSNGSVTGITYNSVALTQIGTGVVSGSNTVRMWYLLSPATGTNNITITGSAGNTNMGVCAVSYTGVKQSSQPDASGTNTSGATVSYSESVTTITNNCWTVMAGCALSGLVLVNSSKAFIRQQPEVTYRGTFYTDSNSEITPAGSTTSTVTSVSQSFLTIMISIAPFTTSGNNMLLMF